MDFQSHGVCCSCTLMESLWEDPISCKKSVKTGNWQKYFRSSCNFTSILTRYSIKIVKVLSPTSTVCTNVLVLSGSLAENHN